MLELIIQFDIEEAKIQLIFFISRYNYDSASFGWFRPSAILHLIHEFHPE